MAITVKLLSTTGDTAQEKCDIYMNVSYLVSMCSFPGLSLVERQAQEELDCANHLPVTGRKHHHCGSSGLRRDVVGCAWSQHGARGLGSFLVDEDQVPRPTHVYSLQHCPLVGGIETPTLEKMKIPLKFNHSDNLWAFLKIKKKSSIYSFHGGVG